MKENRPLVSFVVVAYKHELFIRDAVRSALSQNYDPVEIIFSDDCSPDRTFEIIQEEVSKYHGPKKIILNRNEKNIGIANHINRVYDLTNGQIIITSAGDDISDPNRTTLLVNRLQKKDSLVDLVCSYFEEIDINGKPTGFVMKDVLFIPDIKKPVQQWQCGATGACLGYRRKLFEKYGPLDGHVVAEDWVLPFRAWLESGIALIELPLVQHRTHDDSLSVIHRNVKFEKNKNLRRSIRQQSTGDRLARIEDWYRSWKISGKQIDPHIEKDFLQWIKLLQLEWHSFNSRLAALKSAILSLRYFEGGFKNSKRIFIRNVLKIG